LASALHVIAINVSSRPHGSIFSAVRDKLEGVAMSRLNPLGFVLSIIVEVAAVVFIVSLMPRIDLRPAAAEPTTAGGTNLVSSTLNASQFPLIPLKPDWPPAESRAPRLPPQETSYYQRRAEAAPVQGSPAPAATTRQPPSLITVDPARPAYVEQRLDQASQGLLNGVGSYVARAAEDFVRYQPTAPPQQPIATPPPAAALPRRSAGSFTTTPPRPWMRY
jgi:hypothetical protein